MGMQDGTITSWHGKVGPVFLLLWAITGCGGGRITSTVTGTVSYQGKPVPAGKVSFYGPNDQVASALIGEDGSYEAMNVPLGTVRVAVTTPPAPSAEVVKAA